MASNSKVADFMNLHESEESDAGSESEAEQGRTSAIRSRQAYGGSSDSDASDEEDANSTNVEEREAADAETKDTASKEESEDDYFIGDDAGEDNEDGESAAEDSKKRKERLLSEKDIEAARLAEKRSGVIYMSRVPPFMKPAKVRHLLSKYGEIGRIYLAEEDEKRRTRRIKSGGNRKRQFVEGWIEFKNKKYAKAVAQMLNNTQVGGKKHGFYHDDLWNLKYLSKFKWRHLTEQLANEKASKAQRLENEVNQSRRELEAYLKTVDQSKKLSSIKAKREAKLQKGEAVKPMEDLARNVRQRDVMVRGKAADDNGDEGSGRKRRRTEGSLGNVLSSIF
ncbi:RNA-binding ATPase activator esf2 [Linderina pennispora]|nr:RNA-binding ATPase activator esf2 [Linderina pennispora]